MPITNTDIDDVLRRVAADIVDVRALTVDQEGRWQGPPPTDPAAYHPEPDHTDDQAPFRVLVSCLISLRTKDEVTGPATERLFKLADTPIGMAELPAETIARTIYPAGFYNQKGETIRRVSRRLVEEYDGRVPDTVDELTRLKGVGRKTANLVVTVGHGKPGICVDTHVHRIVNRWGYVATKSPDQTERELRKELPREWWIPINSMLVVFGRERCQPVSPHCSDCPLLDDCPRLGVEHSR
ncbi:MAG: endonuclease III [Candidatus Coatesbacteria bacterium]|nr:endonuclease III [Candidatus Coatesbacteria bacterium]